MIYRVEVSNRARRELARLDSRILKRIRLEIDNLAAEARPPGCTKLAGFDEVYRIRVGDYRVICQVREKELVVLVIRLGARGDVYQGLYEGRTAFDKQTKMDLPARTRVA